MCHGACQVLLLSLLPCLQGTPRPDNPAGVDHFEKKIRPVLFANCYKCHASTAKRVKGGLLLDSREGREKGGDSGPAIVPGQPDVSLLIRAIRHEDPDLEMPPRGKLPDHVIADFERWVAMGAPDPRTDGEPARPADVAPSRRAGPASKEARRRWTFRVPERPAVPDVNDAAWPRSDIDRFILARLEAAGVEPVRDADRRDLLRRVHFALTGLPPTPEQIAAFLADRSPDAFATVVDELLASPHFGERWGRHWLDVARYAESSGGGRSQLFRNAWRYREYVIEALNRDKPFDRFVVEQIAGDLLPAATVEERTEQLIATGFLALGPKNLDHQDKELLRMDVVDEQLDTLGRTFLGLTIGCARCHDHKFDPIPTREYYAVAGILRSTKTLLPGNVSGFVEEPLPGTEDLVAAEKKHKRAVADLRKRIDEATQRLGQTKAAGGPVAPSRLGGLVLDDSEAERVGEWKHSTYHPRYVGDGYIHDDDAGKGRKTVRFVPDLPHAGVYEVQVSYTPGSNRASAVPVSISRGAGADASVEATVRIDQRAAPPIDRLFRSLGRHRFEKGRRGSVSISNDGTDGHVIVDAVRFVSIDPPGPIPAPDPASARESATGPPAADAAAARALVDRLRAELKSLESAKPPSPPTAMVVRDEERPEDAFLCIRGNVHSPGEVVPRGFLAAVGAPPPPVIEPTESGRRQLARWIASPTNPLTARVRVNRIWHHLFGRGLVASVDNFGHMGEPPTHPELLDWLAARFVASGWSTKRLIREILLSRAYRLSSEDSAAARAADPENRLLWRLRRQRLEAEVIRDAVLSVSGGLDLARRGTSVEPSVSSEFGYEFNTHRRSVYIPVFRNRLHEIFEVFDFADPNLVVGGRPSSTVPTQALYLMNSPFILEQSRRAAAWLLATATLDDGERVDLAYERALGRWPSAVERELALSHIDRAGPERNERLDAWAGLWQALFSCIDFRYVK